MADVFPAHDETTAPEGAREAVASMKARLGFVPTMLAKFAEAPALLKGYQALSTVFDTASLTAEERLVVLITTSRLHGCDFCVSAHSWGARRQGQDADLIAALRNGEVLADRKLEALHRFTEKVVLQRGSVGTAETEAFLSAGYTPQKALEVILGVALKVMTNYTNALASTPPNPEFGEDLWAPEAGTPHVAA